MASFQFQIAYILLLAGYLSTQASTTQYGVSGERVLRAATRRSDLFRRSVRIAPRFDTKVSYIERENRWNDDSIFTSQINLGSEAPILHLEEIEHHLHSVHCSDGKLKLHFVDIVSARDAKAACHGEMGGRVITSHEGCNQEGERAVYKVNDVTVSDDEVSLTLSVEQSTWKNAFKKFNIDFGYTNDNHFYRRHSDFEKVRRRRQVADPTASVAEVIPIPSGTPEDVTSQTFDVSSQLINSKFALPDFVNTALSQIPLPSVSVPIDLTCKNCTTAGTLVLSQGAIDIDLTNLVDANPGTDVITGGFFELTANDLSAHIELVAKPVLSDTFTVTLPGLPILGFVIPGIGSAGVTFNQTLTVSFDVSESIEVTYGLDVVVPSPSTIRVDLVDFTKSSIVGFPDSKLVPLPFTANISSLDILLSAAYLPSIPIGFEFLDQLNAGITVKMELPRLDLRLSNRDANCNALESTDITSPNTTSINDPKAALSDLLTAIGSLVLVEANVTVSLDVAAELEFPEFLADLNSFNTEVNIFDTTIQLLTSCLDPANGFALATGVSVMPTPTMLAGDGSILATGHFTLPTASANCSTKTVTVTVPYTPPTIPSATSEVILSTIIEVTVSSSIVLGGGGYAPPANTTIPSTTSEEILSTIIEVAASSSIVLGGGGYTPPVNTTVPIGSAASGTGGFTLPSPTAPQAFTGAATPGAFVPTLNWRVAGWQCMVLAISAVAGAMVLL